MTNALWSLSGAKDDWRLISSYGKYLDTRIQNLCTYQTSLMKDLDIIQTILGRPGIYAPKSSAVAKDLNSTFRAS
jgi:hypothetical protein